MSRRVRGSEELKTQQEECNSVFVVRSEPKGLEFHSKSGYPHNKDLATKLKGKELAEGDHGQIPKWIYQNLVSSYETSDLEMLKQIIEIEGTFEEALEREKKEWKETRQQRREDALLLEKLLETKTPEEIKRDYQDSWQGRIIEKHESANKVLEKTKYESIPLEVIIEARKAGKDTFSEWLLDTASHALESAEMDRIKPLFSKASPADKHFIDELVGEDEYLRLSAEEYAAIEGEGFEAAKVKVKGYIDDLEMAADKVLGVGKGVLKP